MKAVAFTPKLLNDRKIEGFRQKVKPSRPKSEEVKAKSRKPPDAREARALRLCLRLAAVAFSIRGISDRCCLTAKGG